DFDGDLDRVAGSVGGLLQMRDGIIELAPVETDSAANQIGGRRGQTLDRGFSLVETAENPVVGGLAQGLLFAAEILVFQRIEFRQQRLMLGSAVARNIAQLQNGGQIERRFGADLFYGIWH